MATYSLSDRADGQIDKLYEASVLAFGLTVAGDYLDSLYEAFDLIAAYPSLGSDYTHLRPGLMRYAHRSHSIYYAKADDSIDILFILHNRQDPARHLA